MDRYRCESCGHEGFVRTARPLEEKVEELRRQADEAKITVLRNAWVWEEGYAKLIGLKLDSVQRQRYEGRNFIPFERVGKRCKYALSDIALYKSSID